jgi:hypothetical protein
MMLRGGDDETMMTMMMMMMMMMMMEVPGTDGTCSDSARDDAHATRRHVNGFQAAFQGCCCD